MPVAPPRRAIILIPGLQRIERFARRDLLIDNLQLLERRPMRPGEPVAVLGEAGRRVLPLPLRGALTLGPELDIFEAYWADLVTPPAELGPFGRLWSGFELILYWLFSKGNLRAIGLSPTIALGLIAGGVLLLLWYASLAVLVAAALRADPVQSQLVTDIPLLQALLERFLAATAWVEATAPYAFVTLLLATFKTDELAQMAQFTKDYLENTRTGAEPGLRDRVRRRVAETLDRVLAEPYEEIVIVGHSVGSVIAIDLLAGWPHPGDRARLGLVTWGSPEAVLACRSRWLAAEREALFAHRPGLWLDFFSPTDWLCTAVTGHAEHYPRMSHRLVFDAPILARATGRTHMLYYSDPTVLEALAAPVLGEADPPPDKRGPDHARDHAHP